MSDRSGRPANEKSGPAILHASREFRIVGLDISYSDNNFVFSSDAQLQHFLATIPPHFIARVQHVTLAFTITFSYNVPWHRDDLTRRARGVVNHAAIARFPKLRSVHLYISLVLDESVLVASWVVARFLALGDLSGVLAIETWPESVPWPTHTVEHHEHVGAVGRDKGEVGVCVGLSGRVGTG
jgi:hypothetical protein